MPDLVVSNLGEVALLNLTLRLTAVESRGWRIHLYQNDYTPTRSFTIADLVESTFPSYLPKDLDDGTWSSAITSGGQAISQYGTDPLVWTPSSDTGEPVYGFYVTDSTDMVALWAQRLDTPITPTTLIPVTLLLSFAGRSQSEPSP